MAFAPLLLALAITLPAAPPPTAEAVPASATVSTAEAREQVQAYLGAIHGAVPAETFRALGPAAVDALVDFARTDPMPMRRLRALDALAALRDPRAEAIHREVLASDAPRAVRRAAVRGLAWLAGPARAPEALAPLLERDRDPAVRAAAAEALSRAAPAAGCARIRARARVEPEPARFGRALETCDRASAQPPGR
jgi:HEAT repeat protein